MKVRFDGGRLPSDDGVLLLAEIERRLGVADRLAGCLIVYCARDQAENLIKAHKLHLASDRASCTRATANPFRLLIHSAAYTKLP